MSRLIRLGDALSQFFNVLIYNGDPNYSISGESYHKGRNKTRAFIDFIFKPFEKDHCKSAYENDLHKALLLVSEKLDIT